MYSSDKQAAARYAITRECVWKWAREQADFPKPIKLNARLHPLGQLRAGRLRRGAHRRARGHSGVIEITVTRPAGRRWDRRGLLFDATARYGDLRFEVSGVHQPVRAAIRAVIAGSPAFADSPWQLVREGRVDLFGPSARRVAVLTVSEGDQGTRFRRDEAAVAAIYAASETSEPVMTGDSRKG